MTQIQRMTTSRDPNSFNDQTTIEISQRVLLRKTGEENFEWYEPPEVTLSEFNNRLLEIGKLHKCQSYIDTETNYMVYRGILEKDSRIYPFHVFESDTNKIYKSTATAIIQGLVYAGMSVDVLKSGK